MPRAREHSRDRFPDLVGLRPAQTDASRGGRSWVRRWIAICVENDNIAAVERDLNLVVAAISDRRSRKKNARHSTPRELGLLGD
jgi:hypothetical protein